MLVCPLGTCTVGDLMPMREKMKYLCLPVCFLWRSNIILFIENKSKKKQTKPNATCEKGFSG